MASSLSTIVAKDGTPTTIAGGLLAVDKSGAGTGPFFAAQTLVDTQGVNTATIKAATTAVASGDTALAVGLHPTSPLPAGTNVIGHVIVDTLPSGAVTNTGTFATQSAITAAAAALADGSLVTLGAKADAANAATDTTAISAISILKQISKTLQTATAAATPAKAFSAASTNATSLKASAGTIYAIVAINTTATLYYLKLYDKATAPTVGTDVPIQTYPVPANTSGAGEVIPCPVGMAFANGIAWALTGGLADADTSNAATGIAINFQYK